MHSASTIDSAAFLRIDQVLALVPIARSTLWLWCRTNRFPRPVKLSERTTTWRRSDVVAWLEAHAAAHDERARR